MNHTAFATSLIAISSFVLIPSGFAQPKLEPGSMDQYNHCVDVMANPAGAREATYLLVLAANPANDSSSLEMSEAVLAIPHLEKVAKACAGECKGATNLRGNDVDRGNVEMWCKLGADRTSIIKRAALNQMRSWRTDRKPIDEAKIRAEVTEKEGYLFAFRPDQIGLALVDASRRKQFADSKFPEYAKLVGITDAEYTAVVNWMNEGEVVQWKVLDELGQTYYFPKKLAKDAAIEALAKKYVVAETKGSKVLATVMRNKDYVVRKTPMNVPIDRYKDGTILYQVPGETMCRQNGFTYTERWNGKKYDKPVNVKLNLFRMLPCKNIK